MTDRRPINSNPDIAPDPVCEAWAALRSHLESRSRELSDEIRHYPTPIARCDEQLTKLLEQRAHAQAQLSLIDGAGAWNSPQAGDASRASMERFVRSYAPGDDEAGLVLVARLKAALAARRTR